LDAGTDRHERDVARLALANRSGGHHRDRDGERNGHAPTWNIGRRRSWSLSSADRLRPSVSAFFFAGSRIGSSADITRSGGNVTITSVPSRSFDRSEKVPPCRSTRFFTIGRPRPAPCSADLIAFEPWPKESSTIGISSSGIPGPVSRTVRYCPPDAVQPALSQISPPCGVNLMALERRLRQTCRTPP